MPRKCCTVGKFESFHLGHRKLLNVAKSMCSKVVVISILKNKNPIFTLDERREIAKSLGVELLSLDFDSIRNQTPEEFFSFLKGLGCNSIIAGEDWHFGVNRSGDINVALKLSRKFGLTLRVVRMKTVDGHRVSTSAIRKLLLNGRIEKANRMLGFNYFCTGTVVRGNGIGSRIGFPTANIRCTKELPLLNGVYVVNLRVENERFKAIANLGVRPTLIAEGERVLEVHVPKSQLNLYGRHVKVEFLSFLRREIRFGSAEELRKQIERDISGVL